MNSLAVSARKEFRLLVRDPFAILLWLAIPFSIMLLMNLAFGSRSSGPAPSGILLVADHDATFVSSFVSSAFSQGPMASLFTVEKTGEPAARARLSKGEASALIVIPKGFGDAVLNNRPTQLSFVTNPAQTILPAIAGETLTVLSEAVHYIHIAAGEEIKLIANQKSPTQAQVASTAIAVHKAVESLLPYVDPPLIELDAPKPEAAVQTQPAFNLLHYLFPGMIFMTVLFLTRGASDSIWTELRLATLHRLLACGVPLHAFVLAKLLAAALLSALVALLALLSGRWLMGVEVANWPAAIGWFTLCSCAWYLLMLCLQALATSQNRGEIVTSLVIFPSMMLGGAMFPFAMMPDSIAAIGKATPLGWMVVHFESILRGQATASSLVVASAAVAAASLVLFAAGLFAIRKNLLKG